MCSSSTIPDRSCHPPSCHMYLSLSLFFFLEIIELRSRAGNNSPSASSQLFNHHAKQDDYKLDQLTLLCKVVLLPCLVFSNVFSIILCCETPNIERSLVRLRALLTTGVTKSWVFMVAATEGGSVRVGSRVTCITATRDECGRITTGLVGYLLSYHYSKRESFTPRTRVGNFLQQQQY